MLNKNLILYTDDNNLEMQITKTLSDYDINIITCNRWIYALLEILDREFSVVIIDEKLRSRENSDLIALVKKYSPKTFIILLTSKAEDINDKSKFDVSKLEIQRPISDLKLAVMARIICDRIYGIQGLGN